MSRRRALWLLLPAPGVLLLALFMARIISAAQAYLFGYPLVIMDLTRASAALQLGPENALFRARQFAQPSDHLVVRPNLDTLYTFAFIDMARGPWVFEMGVNQRRYELMPFMDGWTNVFAAPGTRQDGGRGARYLLAGARWQGTVPAGMTLLRAPTRIVWLIGRTQANGVADYPLVHRLQDGLTLRSLADAGAGRNTTPVWQRGATTAPAAQMQAMSTLAFFSRLAALLPDNPPVAGDAPMVAQLATLGVVAGRAPHWNWIEQGCVALGRHLADWQAQRQLRQPRALVRGWSTPPSILGNYGREYALRAAVAMAGLGANLPADAMYPYARVDGDGRALDGSTRYRLHFEAGALPPVRAFWSVTAYGADDFLLDIPGARHAIGDRDPLNFNPDGSLDLLVQARAPADARERSNWLPVRAGRFFILNARLYWPKPEALDGRWGMPAIERLDQGAHK